MKNKIISTLLIITILTLALASCDISDRKPDGNIVTSNDESTVTETKALMQTDSELTSDDEIGETVWVTASGSKYHLKSTCSSMSSPMQISIKDAIEQGYTACKRCCNAALNETTAELGSLETEADPLETSNIETTPSDNSTIESTDSTPNDNEPEETTLEASPSDDTAHEGESVETVWVTASGTKYHSTSNCSSMKSPTQISLEEAIDRGYTACKRCHDSDLIETESNTSTPNDSETEETTLEASPSDDTAHEGESVETVWVTASGTKYHSTSNCSSMKSPTQISLEEAIEQGYTACQKCH